MNLLDNRATLRPNMTGPTISIKVEVSFCRIRRVA